MINKKNRILAVFFIVFFVVNVVLPSIILLNFKVNQEYITNNLCVEKDIKESTCAGNCQLKKALEVFEKENPNQEELNFNIESHINFLFTPVIINCKKPIRKELKSFIDLEAKNLLSGFYDIPFLTPILL